MQITVSIISYNQCGFLVDAVDSVLGQTLMPDTIRIIDDCSTDTSRDLIRAYSHQYPGLVKAVFHEQNQGVCACRNEAIARCGEGLHTFLDGDDRFLAEKLECEYSTLQQLPRDRFAFGNINYIDHDGNRMYTWADAGSDYNGDVFARVFGRGFPRRGLFRSELIDIDAYKKAGGFDPALGNLYEDYDMRIRLSRQYRAAYIDRPLSEYRIHDGGLSRQEMVKHIRNLNYILDKHMVLLQDLSPSDKRTAMRGFLDNLHAMSLLAAKESLMDKEIRSGLAHLLKSMTYKVRALTYTGRTP